MHDERFLRAVRLARIGAKREAIELFQGILEEDPADERAWLWLVDCLEEPEVRRQALETCVKINPEAEQARAALARLQNRQSASETGYPIAVTGAILAEEAIAKPITPNEWARHAGARVFTTSPDAVSPDEVAERESRVYDLLAYRSNETPDQSPWEELEQSGEALIHLALEKAGRSEEISSSDRRQHLSSQKERLLRFLSVVLTVLIVLLLLTVLLVSAQS